MDAHAKTRLIRAAQVIRNTDFSGRQHTSYGTLYEPQSFGLQIALLVGSFVGGPALGWLLNLGIQGLTPGARLFLCVPPTLVFFLGYALWSARLAAIAFDVIGKSILRVIFRMIVKRETPQGPENLLPDPEKLTQLVVRAQKAGWSFFLISIPIAVVCVPLLLLFGVSTHGVFVNVGSCLLWGYCLGTLGRRGYLPLPEPGD
jgi:hypothetical protein